jgi:hypothetical protein
VEGVEGWRAGGLEGRQGNRSANNAAEVAASPPFLGQQNTTGFPLPAKRITSPFLHKRKRGDIVDCIASILYYFMPVCITL